MKEHELCGAIHHRQVVQFWYRGGLRLVEPYAFGVGDGGHPLLRAYQVSGFSRSREQGWKLFHVDEITKFNATEQTFVELRLGYMRNDPSMTKIYCEL
ncbi:MAG: hypothetical protein HQ481_01780 [Alphaproteobacteria bacterium]|nr:hypothetical protein [Alphaproteobacteria bacterium]